MGLAGAQMVAMVDPQQDAAAADKLRPLAEAGDPEAQLALGIAYDLGRGVPSDAAVACAWYARAGDAGLGTAEFDRAAMQDAGRCGARDPALTALWYARAAAHGHARAQYDLALLYAAGDGVPHNGQLARAWAAEAALGGVTAPLPPSPPPPVGGALHAADAVWPRGGIVAPAGSAPVPLVWTTADEPDGTAFSVEVFDTAVRPPALVATATTPRSAAAIRLPPGRYAWRVLAANDATRHYVSGAWTAFQVAARP